MPRKKIVDGPKLIQSVAEGLSSKGLMEKFQLKTSAQLKCLYLDALVEAGQAVGIAGGSSKSTGENKASKKVFVNARGSLIIPKELVDEMGFVIENAFAVRQTKSGLSLKKM